MVDVVLEVKGLEKRFPGVDALKGIDLTLVAGEVHILLGENGAGKSTFLKILSGVLQPDKGEIYVGGRRVLIPDPQVAKRLGIALVSQELSLVPYLSVAENIVLGDWPLTLWGGVDWRRVWLMTRKLLQELGVGDLDPRTPIADLGLAERQVVEIARALGRRPKILLLDEPTSALSERERSFLFSVLRRLREQGITVLYTTHKLDEVLQIGDRVTVFRDGSRVATLRREEIADESELIELIVGHKLFRMQRNIAFSRDTDVILEVRGLKALPEVREASFVLRRGEILGIFGLAGSGASELIQSLYGVKAWSEGSIKLGGRVLQKLTPAQANRLGLGYVSGKRQEALIPHLPPPPNVALATVALRPLWGRVSPAWERKETAHWAKKLGLIPLDLDRPVRFFSGGNQQKLVLARWLMRRAQILLLNDPTRGVDVGAREEMLRIFRELAQEGKSIIFYSSEPRELHRVADRVLVMHRGRIIAELSGEEASEEALLREALRSGAGPQLGGNGL